MVFFAICLCIAFVIAVGSAVNYHRGVVRRGQLLMDELAEQKATLRLRLADETGARNSWRSTALAETARSTEWKAEAVRLSARVRELTDRLLLAGKIPSLDTGTGDPPSVRDADRQATKERVRQVEHSVLMQAGKKFRELDREPLAVSDNQVAPSPRLDAVDDPEGESTDFVDRIAK